MWYKFSQEQNLEPNYELKVITLLAKYAVKNLLRKQSQYDYNPRLEESMVKKVIAKLLSMSNDNISNVRLHSKGSSMKPLIDEVVYDIYGKKYGS
jgi:transcriptional/translational regulatory protein YebC/TACO1